MPVYGFIEVYNKLLSQCTFWRS